MKLIPVSEASGLIEPEGVDFDGANDYLSRASDLTGNADGKTFTFSAWGYFPVNGSSFIYANHNGSANRFRVNRDSNGKVSFVGWNTSGTVILNASSTANDIPLNTFVNIMVSIDLTNTSSRYVYAGDVNLTPGMTWDAYTNDTIDFTISNQYIGTNTGAVFVEERLAHVYFDYTYRDLSIESNRRLFITDDLKPADGQASLNPILYLPMTDASTAHINEGTGGDFTPNGTYATSQRGANQNNCVASEFDGVDDYLSSTGVGASDSKTITFSCTVKRVDQTTIMSIDDGSTIQRFQAFAGNEADGNFLSFTARNLANTTILQVEGDQLAIPYNVEMHCTLSLDLTDTNKKHLVINGVEQTGLWSTYTNDTVELSGFLASVASRFTSAVPMNGSLGELYFDTNYIDLASNNPFWNSDTNRPKPVRQVLSETGNTPLIAMPIEASNPELNLGTGGNFTLNGGGLVGARGGSEYWARSANFGQNFTDNHLVNSSFTGGGSSKTTSCVFAFYSDDLASPHGAISITDYVTLRYDQNTYWIEYEVLDAGIYKSRIYLSTGADLPISTWHIVFICTDTANSSNNFATVLGQAHPGYQINDSIDALIPFGNATECLIGKAGSNVAYGDMSFMYFTTDYIDFSQESNRLKFVDGLGYPIDIQPAIDAGDIPNPLIHMKFEDPDNLGLNSGTGGNFTVNGTVTSGSDVNP